MALKNQYSTNLNLAQFPEFDQKKYPEIWADSVRLRQAIQLLQAALDNYTGALSEDPVYQPQTGPDKSVKIQNITRVYCKAGEDINIGKVISFRDSAGTLTAVLADAGDMTKPGQGFCSSPSGVLSGDFGEFILLGINPFLTGIPVARVLYLGTTPGQYTVVPPSGSGEFVQILGFTLDSENLWFNPSPTQGLIL